MEDKEKTLIQDEIIKNSPELPHGRYILSPRIGKGRIAIGLIKKHDPESILWVTPSRDLAENDIPREFETWKAKKYLNRLETSTWASLNKVKGHKTMIILDEEQHVTEANLSSIFSGELTCDYIISMTGTKSRSQEKKNLYERLGLEILFDFGIDKAVNEGVLADYKINVLKVNMSIKKNIDAGNAKKKFKTSEYAQYNYLDQKANTAIYTNPKTAFFAILARMRAIYNSPSKLEAAKYLLNTLKGRKMFFCSETKQAEALTEFCYHSKSKNNKYLLDFKEGKTEVLALVNKGGTGHTYKNIDHLIIVQADKDENGMTSQKIARTLLKQGDYKASIWIICLMGTKDELWVDSVLRNFNKDKVEYVNFEFNGGK